ncbi:MAG: 30S ribosomal protein S12 methylthiotransferase RimO, partial [Clostridia bacterium]|nr:30S ribosomal protein S12 methylthiotransferase RimO [Clostridia bacterium]
AQRYGKEIFDEMPEVDAVIGTGAYDDVVNAVKDAYEGAKHFKLDDPCRTPLGGDRVVTTPEHFAYIRIAEGCSNNCTYCIIPKLRGKYRSREMSEIITEAQDLAAIGVKEICLVAQDTTNYGADIYGSPCLDALLDSLSEIDGIEWIRVLYCYPEKITDGLIKTIAENPKVVKYIDMPIQHINDDILRRMNRRGNSALIKGVIAKLRAAVPGIALRTSLITGFPGETDGQFEELLQFVKDTEFERLGVFEYSCEEDTPAAGFPDQVPEKVKKKRCDAVMRAQKQIHAKHNKQLIGKTLKVICEGYDNVSECFFGRSEYDCPDIDGKIYFFSSRNVKEGEFVNIKINEAADYDLIGSAVFTEDENGKDQPAE